MKDRAPRREAGTPGWVQRRALLSAGLALVLLALVWWGAGGWYRGRLLDDRRDEVTARLLPYGGGLASEISHHLSQLQALKALVETDPSQAHLEAHFETFAAGLCSGASAIRALTIAPGGVNQYVYPLEGNEAIVGHDQFQDEQGRTDLQRALETRLPTVSGPFELRQGGLGLVARQAVYQDGEFWGLVGMALDVPEMLADVGLEPPPSELRLAIRDNTGRTFFGEESVLAANPATYRVDLPEGSWLLAAVPAEGWDSSIQEPLFTVVVGALVVSGLVLVLVYVAGKERAALDASVQERTAELIESEGRWRSLTDDSPDHIIELDRELKIRFVNRASPGLTREGVRGLPLYKLVGEERQAEIREMLENVLEIGEPARYETEYETPDHRLIYYESRAVPRQVGGEVVGVLVHSRDITERKLAEKERDAALEALQEHSALLEQRVEERTQALRDAQQQLLRQEKLAVLGQLAGGIGHELRNPLTVVSNAAHFLQMVLEEPDQDVADTLVILQRQAARINRIIESLLGFARTEAPALEPVDVCEVVRNTLAQVEMPEQVEVMVRCDPALPSIRADSNQLHLVLRNLIQNGIEAMTIRAGGQGGRLTITAGPATEGEGVLVAVRDSGAGIPAEQLERIFEPLFSTKVKGVGLGLALARILVERHGGTIAVESDVGKGSIFTVFLPQAGPAGADSEGEP
jgi:PAS domain S-box-containing protein